MKKEHLSNRNVSKVCFAEEIKRPVITFGALITGVVFSVICIIFLASIGYYSEITVTESELNVEREEIILSGVKQLIEGNTTEKEMTLEVIRLSREYYLRKISNDLEKRDIQRRCLNKNEYCSFWAANGECDIHYQYMEAECSLACQTCEKNIHEDLDSKVGQFNAGVQQDTIGASVEEVKEIREVIRLSKEYYFKEFANNPQRSADKDKCINKHESCSYWAAIGQCDIHYIYMQSSCALACRKCSF